MIVVFSLAQFFLFFLREVINFLAGNAATPFIFDCTFRALNKQQVAGIILTIRMGIGRFAALMAVSYYFTCNGFTKPLIENEIFSPKFILQSLFFNGI
jgi:hypothetical protein